MIPKRAIFFWEGPEMSWLRQQSIETFKKLNPDWTICIIGGYGLPIIGDSTLERVVRSDWARYRELHEAGGVYFDTDIVFCKPIPAHWLASEIILPSGADRVVDHVAVLGSEKGNEWFSLLDQACARAVLADGSYNYQSFGVHLVNKLTYPLQSHRIQWITSDSYLPVPWHQAERLWADGIYLSPMTYGVHWYGGDWTSISFEKRANEAWARTSKCLVAKALQSVLYPSGDVEAIRDHLGV